MGKKKFKSQKTAEKDRSFLIQKTENFLKTSLEALNLLPKEKLTELLTHNEQVCTDDCEKDKLVAQISTHMAFGFVEGCPRCGAQLKLTKQGYHCEGVKKDGNGRCRFRSLSPSHKPFLVPDGFSEEAFFTNFSFEKMYRDFYGSADLLDRDARNSRQGKDEGYTAATRENKQFEEYYKKQGVVKEGEFETFMNTLLQPLPSTFRVTGFGRSGKELQQAIENDYLKDILGNYKLGETEIEPPQSLSWYPERMAWQLGTDRKSIRHIPALEKLKKFLVNESNCGNISRQEAVSMIPPLVMDIKPDHAVLDMCAAPGSKTSQLIEFLHADDSKAIPEGVVVANDSDNKRCYLMCHQVKRLQTPCFMVVNHDATQMPGFKIGDDLIRFDRVLADVPCTGDGTFRKNVDAWQKWNPAIGHNLHTLQTRILKRGIEVLKTGGRLVYSTCSLNPIENEAVVATLLREYGGLKLLDVHHDLPGLKFMPGMKSWKVMSRGNEWFTAPDQLPAKLRTQIFPSMFPPPAAEADDLHLERCIRVLPHLQNTGGFFIAVIQKDEDAKDKRKIERQQKLAEAAAAAEKEGSMDDRDKKSGNVEEEKVDNNEEKDPKKFSGKRKDNAVDYDNPLPLKRQKLQGYREDPFVFLEKDDPVFDAIKVFYGLDESFPVDQVLVRCKEGKKRNLYFVSRIVKDLARSNEERQMFAQFNEVRMFEDPIWIEMIETIRIKFINMGVKIFSRSESKYCTVCDYRLAQEGIEVLYPYMRKRIIRISSADVVRMLTSDNPFISQFSKPVQTQLQALDNEGSLVYVFDPECSEYDFEKAERPSCVLIITGWKGVVSARTFLPQANRLHFLRLCGIDYKSKEEIQIEKDRIKRQVGGGEGLVIYESGESSQEEVQTTEDNQDEKVHNGEETVDNCGMDDGDVDQCSNDLESSTVKGKLGGNVLKGEIEEETGNVEAEKI